MIKNKIAGKVYATKVKFTFAQHNQLKDYGGFEIVEIVDQSVQKHQVTKLNTVLLTDGESCSIGRVNKVDSYYSDEKVWGRVSLHNRCQIRDRKIGRVYNACNEWNWKSSITQLMREFKNLA